jgi:molybdenum cofactor guanylyltransferase
MAESSEGGLNVPGRDQGALIGGQGFVLAGGASRRMGTPKPLLRFGGKTLLQNAVEILMSANLPVAVVAAPDQDVDWIGVPVLRDRIPGSGPLGAIYTALFEMTAEYAFLLPCDTPLVPSHYFRLLAREAEGRDIAVPVDRRGVHPLSGAYSRRCLIPAERLLERGEGRARRLLECPEIRVVRFLAREKGLPDWTFHNVNTAADYLALAEHAEVDPSQVS